MQFKTDHLASPTERNKFPNTQSLQDEEKKTFILSNMSMVKAIASKMVKNLPPQIDVDDLVQEGILGLMDAMN